MDRVPARGGLVLDNHARESFQDDFDATQLIDAAPWAVHILHADGNAHNGRGMLSELRREAALDIRLELLIELEAGGA